MSGLPALKDAALELDGRVAVLVFKRDDMRNALSGTHLTEDICATLEWANASPGVSVLILTGDGSAFSAGGNIKAMRNRAMTSSAAEMERYYRYGIQRIPRAMNAAEIPVIAAVNGPAIGAGFDLVNMCDIRIGSSDAQFGETFINLGLMAGDGGGWFLRRAVGAQRAAELTLTGRVIKAEEARALGILLEVTEPGRLLERAKEIAAQIASRPPLAVRYAKRALRLAQHQGLEEHLDSCASFQAALQKTGDHLEALSAFFEKRSGVFKGE
ncbi:MAG TPA: enoyl-CoA hydratase-related protein [Burkholderiales bacterium]|nr:enoyl-CoA hydratase-related protein [Burkholderiales bacterium]